MVLRSCSSLATNSFCPASPDTASVSWICSSAQRTAKQSQGCQPGPKGTPRDVEFPPRVLKLPHKQQILLFQGSILASGGSRSTSAALSCSRQSTHWGEMGPGIFADGPCPASSRATSF